MRSEVGDYALWATIAVVGVVVLLIYGQMFGPWGCEARWAGYETEWGVMSGCRVMTDSGFIPEANFRIMTTP